MTIQEAVKKAHEMYAYELSEQSDQQTNQFDDLWQSIYDVCQLATFGIFEDIEEDEINEAIDWLKQTQTMTKNYIDKDIYF